MADTLCQRCGKRPASRRVHVFCTTQGSDGIPMASMDATTDWTLDVASCRDCAAKLAHELLPALERTN